MTVSEPAGAASLVVLRGGEIGREFRLDRHELTLGRSRGCEIHLTGSNVSRRHLKLIREPDGTWTAFDLGSRNGTTVNGERIERHRLHDNDEIDVGTDVLLAFRSGAESGSARKLSLEDVAAYAAELDATVKLPDFLAWLRVHRVDLKTISPDELDQLAKECLYEFAHVPASHPTPCENGELTGSASARPGPDEPD